MICCGLRPQLSELSIFEKDLLLRAAVKGMCEITAKSAQVLILLIAGIIDAPMPRDTQVAKLITNIEVHVLYN